MAVKRKECGTDAVKGSRKITTTLKVRIKNGRRVVQTVEIPDPRQSFCERYNEMAAQMGMTERASVN